MYVYAVVTIGQQEFRWAGPPDVSRAFNYLSVLNTWVKILAIAGVEIRPLGMRVGTK